MAANPFISEFMASNNNTLDDGFGNASDWIEIFNGGDEPADLTGHYLTDDPMTLNKWPFPAGTMVAPGGSLIVFASAQATAGVIDPMGHPHTNFALNAGGEYLAFVDPSQSIISEFMPGGQQYPEQFEDVSYGVGQLVTFTPLVVPGMAGNVLVPDAADDAAIGSTWTGAPANEPFDDTTWLAAVTGVGFDDGGGVVVERRNVARGGTALQSTNGFGLAASNAIDGNRIGNSISHTNTGDLNPWWEVDLGEDFLIDAVDVYTRDNCCTPTSAERDYNLRIEIRDAGGNVLYTSGVYNPWNGVGASAPILGLGAALNLDLSTQPGGGITGRKVRVTKQSNGISNHSEWLHLAEVEVFSNIETSEADTNIAQGKLVTTSGPLWSGFPNPQLITDGSRGTFTHPATPVTEFSYTIDLGQPGEIGRIEIYNRADGCCPERLSNYRVSVYNDNNGSIGQLHWTADVRTDDSNSGPGGVDILTVDLDEEGSFYGRFIVISRIDTGAADYWPQIAEVEVYAPLGYDDLIETDLETPMKNVNASAYLRVPFTATDVASFDQLTLGMQVDDGFVAYLNGVEVARHNSPIGAPAYNAAATAEQPGGLLLNFDIPVGLLLEGDNVLAVHALNIDASDGDFLAVPRLTARTTTIIDAGYFLEPTPGEPNGVAVAGFVADTSFDVDRGFFDAPFDVTITTPTPGATIVYTLDGSRPTLSNGFQILPDDPDSPPMGSVQIVTTTALRAAAFKEGFQPTNVDTQSYIFLNDVIHQPATIPGLPTVWDGISENPIPADYEMDPDVINNPAYSDEVIQGLLSIPTMSIVMDSDDLWDPLTGIYINSGQRGRAWERPTSVEIIHPDGSRYQADAGIRIHGFSWRFHSNTPKHSFRLEFTSEYGPTKMEYPLFPDAPVDRFDSIVLRAQGGRAWAGLQNPHEATYIRDAFARDLAREMNDVDGHATFVHLYINGVYWGLYNPVERPDADMGEEYFGGEAEDYDALNRRTTTNEAIDGDLVRYNAMIALAEMDMSDPANYAEMQRYVDIDDLIDFFLIHQYTTNRDGPETFQSNNQRAIGSRVGDPMFRFFVWDMEYSMWNATDNININVDVPTSASRVFQSLRANADFRLRYADHVQRHFFNGGPMSPEGAAALWQARVDELYTAIILESARWGDAKRATPYTRDVEWMAENNRLFTQYFPQRTGILLEQLRTAGLYPDVEAPIFRVNDVNQHGGPVEADDNISFLVPESTTFVSTMLVEQGDSVRVHVPVNDSLGLTWTQNDFIVPAVDWTDGTTGSGVGFDTAPDYLPFIQTNIGATLAAKSSVSALIRQQFAHDDATTFDQLTLRIRYDDGFVAYLNGVEVARSASVLNATPGSASAVGGESSAFELFDITAFEHLLVDGINTLAIHGINSSLGSSDMLILPELIGGVEDITGSDVPVYYTTDGSDPRLPGGAINPDAVLYHEAFNLPASALVRTRTFIGGQWSALSETTFTVDLPLRVTEVMYRPVDASSAEMTAGFSNADSFEFIELQNISGVTIDLTGVKFTQGIEFDFTGSGVASLGPGEYVLVVSNQDAFELRYGSALPVAGVYTGNLSNGGETITLSGSQEEVILSFTYEDGTGVGEEDWHPVTDGPGASLDRIDPNGPKADWSVGAGWRPSGIDGGTPGRPDPVVAAIPGDTNYNNVVDIGDLSRLAVNFGLDGSMDPLIDVRWKHGDFNGDRRVNITDLSILASQFGQSVMPGAASGESDLIDAPTATAAPQRVVVVPPSAPSATPAAQWSHIRNLLADDDDIDRIV